MATKLVSIMMPAYNAEKYIKEAIESVLAQTYLDWELIIVNDGSTDRTPEIISTYRDPRIGVLHQTNSGEAAARNLALAHMSGAWVAFLDADDLFFPGHLAQAMNYLEQHPGRDAVYTDGFHIDPLGKRLQTLSSRRRGPFEGRIYEEVVRASDVFGPPMCTVLRHSIIVEHNLKFDERIVIGPDWDFLTHYADLANFGYLDLQSCLYRVHETNITVQVDQEKRAAYLAICRENAIKMPSFKQCSDQIRADVFYDLLINLAGIAPERQAKITQWDEFLQLPVAEQGRLYRLMASKAILKGNFQSEIAGWLQRARELAPADQRSTWLLRLFKLSPGICQIFLQTRSKLTTQETQYASPLGDVFTKSTIK